MKPKKTSDLTRADLSQEAATGGSKTSPLQTAPDDPNPGKSVSLATLDASSPSDHTPGSVGDTLGVLFGSDDDSTYIVEPVERPEDAYAVYKLSPHLAPILSAINVNVYAANVVFEPYIDLTREESRSRVKEALIYEKTLAAGDFEADIDATDEEIQTAHARLAKRQDNERQFLASWTARCCPGTTYRATRSLVGLDMEIMGTGYMEVLRNTMGQPSHLIWTPSWTVRARPMDQAIIPVLERVPVSCLSWSQEWQPRRFRSYVQVDSAGNAVGVYKEFGDPRILSRKTGRYYHTLEQMHTQHDEFYDIEGSDERIPALPATELLSFQLQTPVNTTYGKPDWTGVYPSLLGARELEEENRTILTDQKVPQMFVLVSGGSGIDKASMDRLQEEITTNRASGKKSIYFLQARSAKTTAGGISPNPDMEIVKTKSEQHTDSLGVNYQKNAGKLSRMAYRLPRSEIGDDEGSGKELQQHGHRFAEAQVYDPRRDIIDDRVTTTVLKDLGIQTLRHKLRPRPPKAPTERAEIVTKLTQAGILTPDDGRVEARDILDRDYKDLLGVWSKLPKELLTAILQTKNQLVAAALMESDEQSDFLSKLTVALEAQMGASTPTRPGQVPVPRAGEVMGGDKDDAK